MIEIAGVTVTPATVNAGQSVLFAVAVNETVDNYTWGDIATMTWGDLATMTWGSLTVYRNPDYRLRYVTLGLWASGAAVVVRDKRDEVRPFAVY